MIRTLTLLGLGIILAVAVACSKRDARPQITIEIPPGFGGNFVLDMGVRGAPPLQKSGDVYILSVPRSGKVETSTLLEKSDVTFKNESDGRIWGFSQSVYRTGDGISTGSKLEYFVGTQKEFEAEQNKKNKSGRTGTSSLAG